MQKVLEAFWGKDLQESSVFPIGQGRINDTFLVDSEDGCVVLQRINDNVFPNPQVVAENFCQLSRHLQLKKTDYPWWQSAAVVKTLSGENFFCDEYRQVWRCQSCVDLSPVPELSEQMVKDMGRALGFFHFLCADFNLDTLCEPLPGFHHLPGYLSDYRQLAIPIHDKTEEYCAEIIARYESAAMELGRGIAAKDIETLVSHGDPKIDNFIFGEDGKAVGLLDFDTVYKGVPQIDVGDSLRSLCVNHGDGQLDLTICEGFLRGYLGIADTFLGKNGREYLFAGFLGLAYELGLRFFIDHLVGDVYFKVSRRGENLQRAEKQLLLAEAIVKHEKELRKMSLQL